MKLKMHQINNKLNNTNQALSHWWIKHKHKWNNKKSLALHKSNSSNNSPKKLRIKYLRINNSCLKLNKNNRIINLSKNKWVINLKKEILKMKRLLKNKNQYYNNNNNNKASQIHLYRNQKNNWISSLNNKE